MSTIIVLLSMFLFRSVSISLIYLGLQIGCICIYSCYILLKNWSISHYIMTSFVSCSSFSLKAYFVWYKCSYLHTLLVSTCVEYLFPSIHCKTMCALRANEFLEGSIQLGLVFTFSHIGIEHSWWVWRITEEYKKQQQQKKLL